MPAITRHLSSRDLEAVYDELVPKVIELFNDGKLDASVLFVSMKDEEGAIAHIGGLPEGLVWAMSRLGGTKTIMQLAAQVLFEESPTRQAMLEAGIPRPDIVVHIGEAWCVPGSLENPPAERLSEHPDRRSVVLFALHTVMGSTTQILPVDPATGQVTYSPYDSREEKLRGPMQLAELAAKMGVPLGATMH